MSARRNADGRRRADAGDGRPQRLTVVVENLDALVIQIGDVDVTLPSTAIELGMSNWPSPLPLESQVVM